jgi:heme-degrading monooxygenase HmoA
MGTFAVKPGVERELSHTYNQHGVPRVRAFPGNVGCLLLEPAAAGEPFVVLTLWNDRAAAEAYESSGVAGEVVALVKSFFAGPPTLRSYEASGVGLPSAP